MIKEVMTANKAVAEAVRLAKPQVIPVYPITPQTTISEYLAQYVADEKIDAIFDFIWNNLDFYALLEYFNDEKYKDELMEEEMYRERDNKNNIGRRSYGRTDYPSFMLNMWLKTLIELDVDEIRDIEFS